MAVLFHVAVILIYTYVSSLIPERKLTPDEVEVTWIETPSASVPPEVNLPPAVPPPPVASPASPADKRKVAISKPLKPPKAQPNRPKPKKLAKKPPPKERVPELALLKPKPPEKKPAPEPEKPKPKAQLKMERHKKVEVDDDEHVVNEPPPDANYLSDKNRRVLEEKRDTRTNLEKLSKGKHNATEKSDDHESAEVGGPDDMVRQLEKSKPTTLERKEQPATAHNGKKEEAKGVLRGDKATGATGEGGKGGDNGRPGALAMRNVAGRGAPGAELSMSVAPAGRNDDAPAVAMSDKPGKEDRAGPEGKAGRPGKPGKRGPKLQLTMNEYERAMGADAIRDEIALSKRVRSHKKGRWEKKLDRIHAALENFTPEVRPGNQEALNTRAAPFAVFIARMHRKIHELWGFGFLEDLDSKSPSNPMNDRRLEVTLEIVLNGDGSVDKATIVKPSGILPFDVAAIDVVENAGPFEQPPREILSANGKVYIHWVFHRDERQCSPYFADPFILDNPPGPGVERGLPSPEDAIARRHRRARPERLTRKIGPTEGGVQVPHVLRTEDSEAAAARANINTPTPDDPAAQNVAIKWADAFEAGRLDRLVALSGVPFTSGGQVVAKDRAGLARVWRTLLDENARRSVKDWKLLSPAGYRAVFGRLPKGSEPGENIIFLAARVAGDWVTVEIAPTGDGKYEIRGFTR